MRNLKRIVALVSIFTLSTVTNIFAATATKTTPKVEWSEIVLGIGVGLLVAYGIKAFKKGKRTKSTGMYDGKGAKVPPMRKKKKKKKK